MFEEGSLRCVFPTSETLRPERTEHTLKLVDFVWQPPEATWLIEIKDPEGTPEPHRQGAIRDAFSTLTSGQLVDEHLLPKLFGTYVWLARQGALRPLSHRYAVIVAMDELDAPLRLATSDRIQRTVDAVGPIDRSTERAPVVEVHNLVSWNGEDRPAIERRESEKAPDTHA